MTRVTVILVAWMITHSTSAYIIGFPVLSNISMEFPDEMEDLLETTYGTKLEASAGIHWSLPAGSIDPLNLPTTSMGVRGSMGVSEPKDVLLLSIPVRSEGKRGQYQVDVLGYRNNNATIDHFRWVYVGEDGYTANFHVRKGGLGFNYISFYIKSQDDHGTFYNISIYGRYNELLQSE